jgi:hypothetical protein
MIQGSKFQKAFGNGDGPFGSESLKLKAESFGRKTWDGELRSNKTRKSVLPYAFCLAP